MAQILTDSRTADVTGGGRGDLDRGFGDYGSSGEAARRAETAKLGLWLGLGSVSMLFAAFTSAYIVRSAGNDWVPLQMPPLLWLNSAVLLLSSVTMEIARRNFNQWRPVRFRKWIFVTSVLGALFLVGQVMAWNQLAAQGIYLSSHPHSSFFYVLTAVHGLHLLAGVLLLFYVLMLAARYRLTPGESVAPSLAATYWHFVDGLWLYLMVVLFYL
jgi:cytochrome c oxidase subunit III